MPDAWASGRRRSSDGCRLACVLCCVDALAQLSPTLYAHQNHSQFPLAWQIAHEQPSRIDALLAALENADISNDIDKVKRGGCGGGHTNSSRLSPCTFLLLHLYVVSSASLSLSLSLYMYLYILLSILRHLCVLNE
jgi:hypothetical protein